MTPTDDDAIADVVFCEFTTNGQPIYIDLCAIEACVSRGASGSIISTRSGADYMVDDAPMVVMSSVMMVSNNSAGRALRAQQIGSGFGTFGDIFSDADG